MPEDRWSAHEKKIARRVFEQALAVELAQTIAEFKARAAAIAEPDDVWPLEEFLQRRRREIDVKYDYRYSRLRFVFGQLLREGRISEEALAGMSEDKLAAIRRVAEL